MTYRIWGFDPGLTVGVGVIDVDPFGVRVQHSTYYWHEDAVIWYGALLDEELTKYESHVVVENYVGSGPVGKEGRITSQLAGYFYYAGAG
jgi:hypothetical protein